MLREEYSVEEQDEGLRADVFVVKQLAEFTEFDFSRTFVQRLFSENGVLVNGVPCAKSRIIARGDVVTVIAPLPQPVDLKPQDIPLNIVYEDDCLLVVDKPRGMVVHPGAGNPDGTLVNALMFHCEGRLSGINGELRPGIVHRIDKDTSGLLVVAKNDMAHHSLAQQIQLHTAGRGYCAVVHGNINEAGEVEAPIGRNSTDRKKMCVTQTNSKYAKTLYTPLKNFEGFCEIECRLLTGRTHQIRVHMAHIGHPVAGDTVYGPASTPRSLGGQCLHAFKLGFEHPETGERLLFTSPLPDYFTSFISTLREKK